MELEVWKDIPGFEGKYQASTLGNIKSLNRQEYSLRYNVHGHTIKERILKPRLCGKNRKYLSVVLYKNGQKYDYRIHRLVCLTFLGDSDLTVNHINYITTDNRLSNLEYLTNADNLRYSCCKKVSQYTSDGILLKVWDSVVDAQNQLQISHISDAARKVRKTAGGFIWRYEGDEIE